MEVIIEFIKLTIPALLVLLLAYFMIRSLLKSNRDHLALFLEQIKHEQQKFAHEKKLTAQKLILPVKLQAYERLVLFLERIQPSGLVTRLMDVSLSARQFQALLIRTVREEFEHNLSQQLYISPVAWQLVKAAREEVVQAVNLAGSELDNNAGAAALAQLIITTRVKMIDEAIARLKEEIGEFA